MIKPDLRIANATYFTKGGNKLKVYVSDPEQSNGIDLNINMNDFYKFYYRPLYDLMNENEIIQDRENDIIKADVSYDRQEKIETGLPKLIFDYFNGDEKNLEQRIFQCRERYMNINNVYDDLVYINED